MTENEQALAFDVEDLPDLLSQAEAFWMLNAMAYSAALANAYRLIYQGNFSVQDAVQKIVDQVPMSEEIENIVNFVRGSERGIVK